MQKECFDAILLLSGGIDSTTVLYDLTRKGKTVLCLIFDYGQTLIKEVDIAVKNAKRLKQPYKVIKADLSDFGSSCTLISDNEIETGRTFEQIDSSVPSSYVEFRNGILLAYAVMIAESNGIHDIYGGFNGLDSGQYYDDTKAFIKAYEVAANLGTNPQFAIHIHAPFSEMKKSDIVHLGIQLGIDYDTTWSCYKNGEHHCGECDSCKQRQRALENGGFYVYRDKNTRN